VLSDLSDVLVIELESIALIFCLIRFHLNKEKSLHEIILNRMTAQWLPSLISMFLILNITLL